MYKTPSSDDDQQEYPQIVYPTQKRKRKERSEQTPSEDYYAADRLDIPKIRRASLRSNPHDPETSSTRLARDTQLHSTPVRKHVNSPETEKTRRTPQTEKQFIAPDFRQVQEKTERNAPGTKKLKREQSLEYQQRGRQAQQTPESEPTTEYIDEYGNEYLHPRVTKNTSRKIAVAANRHRPIYEPSLHRPRRPREPHVYSYLPFLDRVPYLRHNPAVILISMLALLVILLIPVTIAVTRPNTSVTSSSTGTSQGQPPASVQQLPLNPHEIVIMPADTDHPAPPVLATSAYLLDADTGATLYAYSPFLHLPMLSTTKLMTAAIAVEQGNLDQRITITDAMNRDISRLSADSAMFGIKKGETYTMGDLLYGLLFVSGNDAAIAIADSIGGNLPNFVAEMNQKAHQLGLYDTHFMNPHGLLQTGQFSSAHDLALLGKYSLSLPAIHTISGQKVYHIPQGGNHPERYLINENQFLWWYTGTDGGKTGYDGYSDFIQVMSVTRNHHHLIGVVMHTTDWWTDMRDLMNWGFDSFSWTSPHDVDSPQNPIPYDVDWNFFVKDKKDGTIPTADAGRYYIYTGFSISGPIKQYFDAKGGLKKFGYPTGLQTAPSASIINQQFEHAVISCNLTNKQCQSV